MPLMPFHIPGMWLRGLGSLVSVGAGVYALSQAFKQRPNMPTESLDTLPTPNPAGADWQPGNRRLGDDRAISEEERTPRVRSVDSTEPKNRLPTRRRGVAGLVPRRRSGGQTPLPGVGLRDRWPYGTVVFSRYGGRTARNSTSSTPVRQTVPRSFLSTA